MTNNGRISVFCPTHRASCVVDAWQSVKSQKVDAEVQLVIIPNGGCVLPKEIMQDPMVKVVPWNLPRPAVGALKGFAVQNCDGECNVELDHDDILLPGALKKVHEVLSQGGNKLCFSACIETKPEVGPNGPTGKIIDNLYNGCGWEHAKWRDEFRKWHKYNLPFPVLPITLHRLYGAPNHLRAFTREAYDLCGGYDPLYQTSDDLDLMVRMYLKGTEFIMVDQPLYWQRMGFVKDNTQYQFWEQNQKRMAEIGDANIRPMIHEWCRREKLLKIDLGGFFDCPEGFISVDQRHTDDAGGRYCNIGDDPLPFEDGTVGLVRAYDFLEHIAPEKIPFTVNEIHRVLASGGWFDSHTPSLDGPDGIPGRGAWQDPTHRSRWCTNSFWYFTKKQQARYVPEITARFHTVMMENVYPSEHHKLHRIPYVDALLMAVKPGLKFYGDYGFDR